MSTKPKTKPASFEAAMKELSTITERLESSDVGVEESVDLFERGLSLVAFCREQLSATENKVKEVRAKFRSVLSEVEAGDESDEQSR